MGKIVKYLRKYKHSLMWVGVLLMLLTCTRKKTESSTVADEKPPVVEVPEFNEDSAYAYVAAQLAFGPRVPGTDPHAKCKIWLVEKLKSFGAFVTVQEFKTKTYDGVIRTGYNIIASFDTSKKDRIMLSAHWDSRPVADHDPDQAKRKDPVPGANDGASGVGVLLEIARILSQHSTPSGIDIFFWDLEDFGPPQDKQRKVSENAWGLGSQYWSKKPHKLGYRARYGILLDMVGAKNPTFYLEGFSHQFAPSIQRKIWNTAHSLGYSSYFLMEEANPILDDHYFINTIAGIPTVNIIHQEKNSSTGFYPYWHTTRDDLEQIDKNTLKIVGQLILHVIFTEKTIS
ncbi:MAG: M28 family peptidase [Bacteroidales bacterium]|nr:M28 family peptidase [Bacteroidales bacterium]